MRTLYQGLRFPTYHCLTSLHSWREKRLSFYTPYAVSRHPKIKP